MNSSLLDLNVLLLGTGRVARSLGAALSAAGADVTISSARGQLAPDELDRVDLVLIAVTDGALTEVVARLRPRPGQVVAHTSGRHGLEVLAPLRAAGAYALALHPALPFDGREVAFEGACIGLTADPEALPLAERLCAALGARAVWVAEEQRDLYHAALCHSANHLVTVIADALQLLRFAGIEDPAAILAPLTRAALAAALARGDEATTGPVVRGDVETVSAHVAAIDRADPAITPSYQVLAGETARLGVLRGVLQPAQADTINTALQGVSA